MAGGQKRLRGPVGVSKIWGTPIRSSGASWVPRRLTQFRLSDVANSATSELFPMPGWP